MFQIEHRSRPHPLTREGREQAEFTEALKRRHALRRGLRLAQRYRSFYRHYCDPEMLYYYKAYAGDSSYTGAMPYRGINKTKSCILFRWLNIKSRDLGLVPRQLNTGQVIITW